MNEQLNCPDADCPTNDRLYEGGEVIGMLIGSPPSRLPWEWIRWKWRNYQCLRGRHLWLDYIMKGHVSGRPIRMCCHCTGHQYLDTSSGDRDAS